MLSFRRDSQTEAASLKSPKMVANSAKRLCAEGGAGTPFVLLRDIDLAGKDAIDADEECPGAGEGEGEPKSRRVDENNREGSRLVEEY